MREVIAVPTQLRIYTINRGRLDDFVAAWQRGIYPLRQRLGFRIDGAWAIRDRNEFVWILSLEGTEEEWRARDAAYYASPERVALDPDPAQWIAQVNQWFVEPVLPIARRDS